MTTTALRTKTAVGYARVSTAGQAGERHVSLEVQEAEFKAHCQANSITPLRSFFDVASGRRDSRPQYNEMLQYVADNDVDFVVVLFLDRFGRNPKEIRRFWGFTSRITTSTLSPGETIFDGCFKRLLQVISETCTRPSTPGVSSTKAP